MARNSPKSSNSSTSSSPSSLSPNTPSPPSKYTKSSKPKTYTSKEITLNLKLENRFKNARIEIYGLDHSGPSYEGRVFINNPQANQRTKLTESSGYVGSYYVFGHGGCFGDMGHCNIPVERHWYDRRPSHPLLPYYVSIDISGYLKKLKEKFGRFRVSVVPVLARTSYKAPVDVENIVKFEKIGIVTYD